MKRPRIIVPRLLDSENYNAQNLNAKALLARSRSNDLVWTAMHYNAPDSSVVSNRNVNLVRLWRHQLWLLRMWLFYLQPADLLFYPGLQPIDEAGIRWGRFIYRRRPIVATLEGLAGTETRQRQLSEWAGHPVYCQRVDQITQDRIDYILRLSNHIIAISPFLANLGRRLYGAKVSVLPLGIDSTVFYPNSARQLSRMRVVSAGHVEARKRPELFLAMAEQSPQADFVWYGEGSLRPALTRQAAARGITNISFPGELPPSRLAEAFRQANLFVLLSKSEGVPKVSQEAAACGLTVVLFGYYEAPSVQDGVNGFVVWNDTDFFERVRQLLDNPERCLHMGAQGARLGRNWDWDVVAPQWEQRIRECLGPRLPAGIATEERRPH